MRHLLIPSFAISLCFSSVLQAQTEPVTSPDGASSAEAVDITPVEMIHRALENNFDIRIQRLDVDISEDRIQGARGEFDPVFTLNLDYNRVERRQNAQDIFTGQQDKIFDEEAYRARLGLSGLLATGMRYELTTGSTRRENIYTRRRSLAVFDPEFQSMSELTLIQPLLRNAGMDVNLAQIRILQSEGRNTRYETLVGIESVMGQVLAACFDLEFAAENVRVKEQSLELAQALLGENRRRVEEGRMSPIDVTQAEVRVSEAREELIEAESLYAQRQNMLRELTGETYEFDGAYFRVRGVDAVLPVIGLNRDELAGEMFNNSPIYKSALETVESEKIRLMYAKNQRFPQIDLQLSFGYNGLGGSAGDSYSDYGDRSRPTWGAGIEVSFPIGERTADARVSEATRRRRQALLRVKQTEVQLLAALDNAVREVESGLERRRLIEDAVRLAEEALLAEERRLDAGRTTSYNVLTQQRELSLVQTRALAADAEIRRAKTQLLLIQGTLAQSLGFALNFE